MTLLQHLPREHGNPFVFIGSRKNNIGPLAMDRALKRIRSNGDTVHGMRSTFSDWAHERIRRHCGSRSAAHRSLDPAARKIARLGCVLARAIGLG